MDRSGGLARHGCIGRADAGAGHGPGAALAHAASAVLALVVLGVTIALLVVGLPAQTGWPEPVAPAEVASSSLPLGATLSAGGRNPVDGFLVLGRDTIDGHPIDDEHFIQRMQQMAARIPPAALAGQSRSPRVRYMAQAFTPGDDPGLTEGWFEDPAAALAFGCALESGAGAACSLANGDLLLAETSPGHAVLEASAYAAAELQPPAAGWRCRPLGVAVGSPVFEPDRCEWPE